MGVRRDDAMTVPARAAGGAEKPAVKQGEEYSFVVCARPLEKPPPLLVVKAQGSEYI